MNDSDERQESITIRDYKPESDRSFILATFLRGLYYGDSWFSLIPKNIFMENYHNILKNMFTRSGVNIKIACLKDDNDVILGYSVYHSVPKGIALDWIFTKSAWRNIGVARMLLPKNVVSCTHLTKVGKALKPKNCDFNPFC